MTENGPAQLAAIALAALLPCCVTARATAKDKKEYEAKNGTRIVIQPVSKLAGHEDSESRVEFYSPQNRMLCALDYSSEDSEHGFGVVKATWTPDGKYFVFSMTSSGGHQPWHSPTFFYSVETGEIRGLDALIKAAHISNGDFGLEAPNTIVLTEIVLDEQRKPVKLPLDKLLHKRRSDPALRCSDGKTFDREAMTHGTK